jgi:CubicO group peptidase (beta-lactamase class C family)
MNRWKTAQQVVRGGLASAYPAAVVEVGNRDGVLWEEAFGVLSREQDASPASLDSLFDLASLTKIVATTTLIMGALERSQLALDDPVSRWLPEWIGDDRGQVTIHDLLAHAGGLTAHLPFFRDHRGRQEFERSICTLPLEYPPRTRSIYSDLGFILLGFVLEDAGGEPLANQFDSLRERQGWGDIGYRPGPPWRDRAVPTEVDPWRGRLLVGEVHDENAWALGGAAGHAGLFGTARSVGRFARTTLKGLRGDGTLSRPDTLRRFTTPTAIPGSSRALGWDTMLPTSSCGTQMSPAAFGHTGFTGTSLWIDREADAYIVLLTNRVCPNRANNAILTIRPAFHDAVMRALCS